MSMPATYSLSQRLVTLALTLSSLFLMLAAFVLERSYTYSAEQAVYERMQLQIWLLLADAELGAETSVESEIRMQIPELVQEGRLNQIESDLYAFVFDDKQQAVWRSQSTTMTSDYPDNRTLRLTAGLAAGETLEYRGDKGRFIFAQRVDFELEVGNNKPFTFFIIDGGNSFASQLSAYRKNLWAWLVATLLGLIAVQIFALRWGLRPLRTLNAEVETVRSGDKSKFDERYPEEIAPLTDNLNQLITAERDQRERYRNTLGDLAHSLKTPLAVMRGELAEQADVQVLEQQIERMDQIVAHQLGRAVLAANSGMANSLVDVAKIISRLTAAMEKVYSEKQVALQLSLAQRCQIIADESDMMEVFGNLIDNAFKFCCSKVSISIQSNDLSFCINIEDDGPGVSSSDRDRVLRRGQRLDSSVAGQGIGLSVAQEIIDSYGGRLLIDTSDLGGALISVILEAT